jgi:hypothetical protein
LFERGSEICAYAALVIIIQERLPGLVVCGRMVAIWAYGGCQMAHDLGLMPNYLVGRRVRI